jgi:hypothetical protein
MENKIVRRPFLPIVLIFIFVNLFCYLAANWLAERNIDPLVLVTGDLVLFMATAGSFYLHNKVLHNQNIHAFLRMMYGSLLLKMALAIGATLLYLFLAGKGVSKYAILCCFGLYILYTFAEVKVLMRLSKLQKHA